MMRRIKKLIARFIPGREWDDYTGRFAPEGWVDRRQEIMDEQYARWQRGEPSMGRGTCLACGKPIGDHPMPDRMWRSGPDLCARVAER